MQALDDMLQALVMEDMDPNMPTLQKFLEVSGCRNQSHWSPLLNLVFWEERQGILRWSEGVSSPEAIGSQTSVSVTMTWRPLPASPSLCL